MAYMNQQKKAVIKANLDKALKGTGVKFSLSVRNHLAIAINIKSDRKSTRLNSSH